MEPISSMWSGTVELKVEREDFGFISFAKVRLFRLGWRRCCRISYGGGRVSEICYMFRQNKTCS